ncbi:MAG: methionine synthase [Acidimicrobiia bacterium]|nr:methionine synthase [Acidimicrobiia bacterium]MYE73685.1 methionine synthase [Acidimicrobiia bacterium]MYJ61103.1 methionine synthase [Acidimicrobiia bacterium]
MGSYEDAAQERVLIYDGAFGTYVQEQPLSADDFGGPDLEGCNELLCLTRPELIAGMHDLYLGLGVDAVETATFGAFSVPLAEYGIADQAYEINLAAARIAKEAAHGYSAADRPRWVAGSVGPGTKLASLGQIRYAELRDAFEVQARGLLDGGVDLFIIETQYDLLGAKAAINGCRRAMAVVGRDVPLQVQVTIEMTGRMLPGTEIGAALAALVPLGPAVFGLNCATGPAEMGEHLRVLSEQCPVPVACIPNAGLPQVVDGRMHYDVGPDELADYLARYVTELGVSVIGGCCGTTAEHLQAVVDRCADLVPGPRPGALPPSATSIYSAVPFAQDTSFLIVGERTNANGSRKFRDAMLEGDWDGCLQIAREQVGEGAHLLDLCVDYVGRDGAVDMDELARRFATGVAAPLVLDSTEPDVMQAGLEWIGGRAVLNSANLEDGEGEGSRLDQVLTLAREYGAAVVCLLIDEEGQARDLEWKMRVAHRLHRLAVERYGLAASDLIFDALTFPLSTGDDDLRKDGLATIEAIRRIKAELPGTYTTLGVSNVSFGLKPAARHVLNSMFLHECLEAGLDSAIVHAGRIIPLNRIDPHHRDVCLDLIYDRRGSAGIASEGQNDYDPLTELLAAFENVTTTAAVKEDRSGWPVEQRLEQRIIDGDRDGLEADLDEALESAPALDIVNNTLLAGMKVVGDLFASGEMQLPFVLQSAETMKTAVSYLEPHMEKADETGAKGRIVLATVKGDVHDIGKNLVDIILTNNGYEVHNLGIKVSITEMIDRALEVDAHALGMSGLLVKSTLIMRDNLEELNTRDLHHLPVLLGGAALTRTYVERDMRETYQGRVFYGKDAFEGLAVMDRLGELRRTGTEDPDFGRRPGGRDLPRRARRDAAGVSGDEVPDRAPSVATDNPVFEPPFLGSRLVKGIPVADIAGYVNETALFRNQWQFRPIDGEDDPAFKERIRPTMREQLSSAMAQGLLVPQVVYGYFPVNGSGDDLVVWDSPDRTAELCRFRYPRQPKDPHLCIADFFRPADGDEVDYAAFHIVTMGAEVSKATAKLFADNRYQEYLLLHGLGVEMAEALAEHWHHRIRTEWGFADEDGPTLIGLFRQQYRGGRYSWGYPACPDLEDNLTVAQLLDADRIGIQVGEETSYQYQPEQTTSALICHHPQAKYFVAR